MGQIWKTDVAAAGAKPVVSEKLNSVLGSGAGVVPKTCLQTQTKTSYTTAASVTLSLSATSTIATGWGFAVCCSHTSVGVSYRVVRDSTVFTSGTSTALETSPLAVSGSTVEPNLTSGTYTWAIQYKANGSLTGEYAGCALPTIYSVGIT